MYWRIIQKLYITANQNVLRRYTEKDQRTKTAIQVFHDTSRVYIEGDYYEELLLTFEYNVFETVREYYRIIKGR
jgi:hypothetical protein